MNPLSAIRRNTFLFLATVALVVSATAVLVLTKPSEYRSEAEILVATGYLSGAYGAQVLNVPASTKSQVLVTQTRLASLPAVAAQTSANLGGRFSPGEVDERVSVTGSQDIDIISIVATASAPEEARLLATTYAETVVVRAASFAANEIETALADVRRRLAAYEGETRVSGSERLSDLQESERQLELLAAGADGGLQIAQRGTLPERVDNFALPQIFLGLLVGLVLGAGASMGADRWNRRIQAGDVVQRLNAPILGRLSRPRDLAQGALRPSEAPAREAASLVALVVDDAASRAGDKAIVVSSPARGEGRTTLAASLAVALAESGKGVVLVEGDLRNPRIGEVFNVEPRNGGLGGVLREGQDPLEALQPVPLANAGDGSLHILTAGSEKTEHPGTLLARGELPRAVEALKNWSDYVIIDSPPALDFGDMQFLARTADSIIAAIDDRRTDVAALDRLREMADLSSCRIAGAVVITADETDISDTDAPTARAQDRGLDPSQSGTEALSASSGVVPAEEIPGSSNLPEHGEGADASQSQPETRWVLSDVVADGSIEAGGRTPSDVVAEEVEVWGFSSVPEDADGVDASLLAPETRWSPSEVAPDGSTETGDPVPSDLAADLSTIDRLDDGSDASPWLPTAEEPPSDDLVRDDPGAAGGPVSRDVVPDDSADAGKPASSAGVADEGTDVRPASSDVEKKPKRSSRRPKQATKPRKTTGRGDEPN